MKETRKDVPQASKYWEYRWQKNRGHYENPLPISKKLGTSNIQSLSLSQNGFLALLLEKDKKQTLVVFSLKKPQPIFKLKVQRINCIVISPNGKWLATGNSSGIVDVHDIKSSQKLHFDLRIQTKKVYQQAINDISFNDNSSQILIAKNSPKNFDNLVLLDIKNHKVIRTMMIPKKYQLVGSKGELIGANFLSCDIKSNRFLGATDDYYVYEFFRNHVTFFGPHSSYITKCQFHPENSDIIISSCNNKVIFWNRKLHSSQLRYTQRSQPNIGVIKIKNISSFCISPEGKLIAIATNDGYIHTKKISIKRKDSTLKIQVEHQMTFTGHQRIHDSTFLNKNRLFSVGDGCKYWEVRKHKNPFKQPLDSQSKFCAFHPNKNIVVVANNSGIALYNSRTNKEIRVNHYKGHFSITHGAFDSKGIFYTSGFEGTIAFWDFDKLTTIYKHNFGERNINHFAIINDRKIIAACNNSHIYTLDITTKHKTIHHITELVKSSPHFNDDQRKKMSRYEAFEHVSWNRKNLVAICGPRTWLYILNTTNLEVMHAFDIKTSVCLLWNNPKTDKNYLFVKEGMNIVKYEVTRKGLTRVFTLQGHSSGIHHMAIDKDNIRLISCDANGSILFWPVDEVDNPLVNVYASKNLKIKPYFALKTAGVLYFCSFDNKGNKIGACGGNTASGKNSSGHFVQVWDANYSNMDK